MSRDDEITLKEIDVSFFRDHVEPRKWPYWLLQQTIHTTRKLPGKRARLALLLMRYSKKLLEGITHA